MSRLFITFALILGIANATNQNARGDAFEDAMMERRAQSSAPEYLTISVRINESQDASTACTEADVTADIDAIVRDVLFGAPKSDDTICPIPSPGHTCTKGQWCPRGYSWAGAAPCVSCGHDNGDNRRDLATLFEAVAADLEARINAIIVPQYLCLGTNPSVDIYVYDMTKDFMTPPECFPLLMESQQQPPAAALIDPCVAKDCNLSLSSCEVDPVTSAATCVSIRPWWNQVAANFDGADSGIALKRCYKRAATAPKSGDKCGTVTKSCFFGIQDCSPIATTHPITKCTCMNSVWQCNDGALACPTAAGQPI